MFGLKSKLNDPSLYMIYDMYGERLAKLKKQLEEGVDKDRVLPLETEVKLIEAHMQFFETGIEAKRNDHFNFSIEEIYNMYGQYEGVFVSIEFHRFSDAARKYGTEVMGIFRYLKNERRELDYNLDSNESPRTNDYVKFDVSEKSGLADDLVKELFETGFKSGDIHQISKFNIPKVKAYDKGGIKEIPNTIEIKVDPTGVDPYVLMMNLYLKRLERSNNLTDFEWEELAGYICFYKPDKIEDFRTKIFDEKGDKKDAVRLNELVARYSNLIITGEEIWEFNDLLKVKTSERTAVIEKELKRSTNKSLKIIETEFPELNKSIIDTIYEFKNETLYSFDMNIPIYWNYESYLHIYLRHCPELGVEGHFERKTKFQYRKKEIKRLLMLAIERLLPNIKESLANGRVFRISGNKALYFNGNYYSLHIDVDGRVCAFHPYKNPTE